MKNSPKNIGLLMVTIVAISVGFTYFTITEFHEAGIELDRVSTGSLLNGNVLVRVFDEDGAVKAFRQTDNHIVVTGMEILASQLFNDTRGSVTAGYTAIAWRNYTDNDSGTGNPGSNTGGTIKYMEIGNGTAVLGPLDRELDAALSDSTDALDPDCNRQIAQIDNGTDTSGNNDAGTENTGTFAQINITAIATFDGANCAAGIIQEAGIWTDSNATGATNGPGQDDAGWMFARNTFGSVSLTTNDSLELTWTFTFTDS